LLGPDDALRRLTGGNGIFVGRRQAPQNLPKRRDLCAETQEPPSRSRKTGRK
jgi:hypothetical protein